MGKYVLAYRGGGMAATEAEQKAAMEKWMGWFGQLGAAVSDGGNPFGESTAVTSDGSTTGASAGLTGYSILTADSLSAAADLAKGCPVLGEAGGSVEVYEAIDVM
jgi:hypothetical protein